MTTQTEYTTAAREFVAAYVRTDRQWDTDTMASYVPAGRKLRSDAVYQGPATISDIAAFLRRETVQG